MEVTDGIIPYGGNLDALEVRATDLKEDLQCVTVVGLYPDSMCSGDERRIDEQVLGALGRQTAVL